MTKRQQWIMVAVTVAAGIQDLYQTAGVPESFVIDREGVIVKKVIGMSRWDAEVNQMLIRRLLEERP